MLRVTVLIDDDDEVMKQLRFCVSVCGRRGGIFSAWVVDD